MRAAFFSLAFLLVCACATATHAGSTAKAPAPTPAGRTCPSYAPTGSVISWISIKACGAVGDGSTDDTTAIQAAIDYAFAHNMSAVYCPAGNYKTTGTIYLDPPNDLRVNFSAPPNSGQFTMAFFGDPASSGAHLSGCILQPNFNNSVAFVVGPGNGMRASDFAVVGPGGGYRGLQNSSGIGIGIAGAPGGATGTLIENTNVQNFYTLYMTDVNDACCLADSNTFRKVSGQNGYIGILLYNTQSFINDIIEPYLGEVTIGVDNRWSHQVNIFGGDISASSGQSNSFSISGTSGALGGGACPGGSPPPFCFTTIIAAPDSYVGTVYNAYTIVTPHFGVIPLQMVGWNPSTNVAILAFWGPWGFSSYGAGFTNGDFQNSGIMYDIEAATTIYAAEQVSVARGMGFTIDGIHLENSNACTSLLTLDDVWAGQGSNDLRNIYFNYDISGINANFTQAATYCQQAFPFIGGNQETFVTPSASLRIEGGNWDSASQPVIIDVGPFMQLSGRLLGSAARFNLRVFDSHGYSYGQLGNYNDQTATVARGTGRWDRDYFLPAGALSNYFAGFGDSDIASDFCGYEPCQDRTPNLSPTLYALVSSSLGALGTYPPIACRTVFKSLDWNTTSPAGGKLWLRSASCPGYSYGKNLTPALVNPTPAAVINGSIGTSGAVTWNTSAAEWVFSNGNLTAASLSTDNHYITAVSTNTCPVPSKLYFEATEENTSQPWWGFANPSFTPGDYLGQDANSVMWYPDGSVYVNGAIIATINAYSTSDHLQIALDSTVSPPLLWGKVNGGDWNNNASADPATGVSGVSLTGLITTGNLYPAIGASTQQASQGTANFGATSYYGSLPSGYSSTCLPASLTVNSVTSGTVAIGQQITGMGVSAGPAIISGSGTTWGVNNSQTVSSEPLDLYAPVTYAGQTGSDVLYLDANTLRWVFPGLGITIGSDTYTVTGVYPYLGYVTVISAASNAGRPLSQDYSCSASCTIGQVPFAWTAY